MIYDVQFVSSLSEWDECARSLRRDPEARLMISKPEIHAALYRVENGA